jgi:C-terminal processing protease CtpA/Prc
MVREPSSGTTSLFRARRSAPLAVAALAAALLSGCGGGGGGSSAPVYTGTDGSCSVADQQDWLRGYMNDEYFWYASHPDPDPAGYSTVDSYFKALLFQGEVFSPFPPDRWSYSQDSTSYQRFWGDGQNLGYGLFVAGLEVQGHAERPLRVRYIDPNSPAALAGVQRGDTLISVNGRAASDMVANSDFAVLTPQNVGDTLQLVLQDAQGLHRNVTLSAAVYAMTPVNDATVFVETNGRHTGYLLVKDFISQAVPAMEQSFASFKAQGVDDFVLDLRYNGGGLISTAATLASYVGGSNTSGRTFASLLYNDRHASNNQSFQFSSLVSALGVHTVYVLTGQRTCSASELVINGLRPYLNVVTIGDTTCGKPVGFNPVSYCNTTYSIVNFEAVNANNQGRYFNGLQPTCAVADDLDHALGDPSEGLLQAARSYALYGACPTASGRAGIQSVRPSTALSRPPVNTEGERPGMIAR